MRAGPGRKFSGIGNDPQESDSTIPTFVVFDLDPYQYSGREPRGEEPELHRHAFKRDRDWPYELRGMLEALGLEIFVKTSGRTGLHLYLPILGSWTTTRCAGWRRRSAGTSAASGRMT